MKARAAKPPGPRGKWLVGDIEAYTADRIGWLGRTRDQYGDVVRLSPDTCVVHDPAQAHQVLATTNDTFFLDTALLANRSARDRAMSTLADWMAVRRDIWHGFADQLTSHHLRRFAGLAEADLRKLAGERLDPVATFRDICGRMIVDFCLGGDPADADALGAAAAKANALFTTALAVLGKGESRVRWWPRPEAARATRADQELRDLLQDWVARRAAAPRPSQPRDLLDALLAGPRGSGTDLSRVVSVIRMAMFASHGVPGAAMSWVALRLGHHPDVAARVAAEARELLPADGAVAGKLSDRLSYTAAVVRETLRLHPPQWLLTRTALHDCEVGGYSVREGQEVLICPHLIHRDPRWWADPDEFLPQRWLTHSLPHARHAYLPFGAGTRICPGSGLAMAQLPLLAALLARDHSLRMPDPDVIPPTTNGLLLPDGAIGSWHMLSPDISGEIGAI